MCVAPITAAVGGRDEAAKWIDALRAGIRHALDPLGTWRRRRRGESERCLAGVADRFELERCEREWNRWHSSDGSLLGR
jgi:hypothetical protein